MFDFDDPVTAAKEWIRGNRFLSLEILQGAVVSATYECARLKEEGDIDGAVKVSEAIDVVKKECRRAVRDVSRYGHLSSESVASGISHKRKIGPARPRAKAKCPAASVLDVGPLGSGQARLTDKEKKQAKDSLAKLGLVIN